MAALNAEYPPQGQLEQPRRCIIRARSGRSPPQNDRLGCSILTIAQTVGPKANGRRAAALPLSTWKKLGRTRVLDGPDPCLWKIPNVGPQIKKITRSAPSFLHKTRTLTLIYPFPSSLLLLAIKYWQ
jgi:hypothetical protein